MLDEECVGMKRKQLCLTEDSEIPSWPQIPYDREKYVSDEPGGTRLNSEIVMI